MKIFDKIQSVWNQQKVTPSAIEASDLIKKAEAQSRKVRIKHFWTIGILTLITLILISYFIWIKAYKFNTLTVGLSVMIFMLLFRIALEWISVKN